MDIPPGAIVVRDVSQALDITLDEDPATAFEVATPVGRRSWTRPRELAVRAYGTATLNGVEVPIDGVAMVDENDGYHPHLTRWWWSGGTTELADGRQAGWSVIVGLNDTLPHTGNTRG